MKLKGVFITTLCILAGLFLWDKVFAPLAAPSYVVTDPVLVANARLRDSQWTNFQNHLTIWALATIWLVLLTPVVAGSTFLGIKIYNAHVEARRPRDGSVPVVTQKIKVINPGTGKWENVTLNVNPGSMPTGAWYWQPGIGLVCAHGGAGYEVALAAVQSSHAVAALQAQHPGDIAHIEASRNDIALIPARAPKPLKPVKVEYIDGAPPQIQALQEDHPLLPAKTWTPYEAYREITSTRIPLGVGLRMEDDGTPTLEPTGKLVYWNMMVAPHLRIHGQTQTAGKTNLIRAMAVALLYSGAHICLLDRRMFKDWRHFESKIDMIDSQDTSNFIKTIDQIDAIYTERSKILGREGASNIEELAQPLQRIVVIVSEFNVLCLLTHEDGSFASVMSTLRKLILEAGATGIHFILEAQYADKTWPSGMANNMTPVCGYLPPGKGILGGYHKAHKLKQGSYSFYINGEVFQGWPMKTDGPQLMRSINTCVPIINLSKNTKQKDKQEQDSEEIPEDDEYKKELEAHRETMEAASHYGQNNRNRFNALVEAWLLYKPERLLATNAKGEPNGAGTIEMTRLMAEQDKLNFGVVVTDPARTFRGLANEMLTKKRIELLDSIRAQPAR